SISRSVPSPPWSRLPPCAVAWDRCRSRRRRKPKAAAQRLDKRGGHRYLNAMAIESKICGVSDRAALAAAARGGAAWVGLVFYPLSPRAVTVEQAAVLAREAPAGVGRVGQFVDPDDALLGRVLAEVPLDLLQLHGDEPPQRVAEIRARW